MGNGCQLGGNSSKPHQNLDMAQGHTGVQKGGGVEASCETSCSLCARTQGRSVGWYPRGREWSAPSETRAFPQEKSRVARLAKNLLTPSRIAHTIFSTTIWARARPRHELHLNRRAGYGRAGWISLVRRRSWGAAGGPVNTVFPRYSCRRRGRSRRGPED